jgi:hypothetical protein
MGLYVVNLTVDVVVVADDNASAAEAAVRNVENIDENDFGVFVVREVKTEDDLPDGWDLDDKPTGDFRAIYMHLDEVKS